MKNFLHNTENFGNKILSNYNDKILNISDIMHEIVIVRSQNEIIKSELEQLRPIRIEKKELELQLEMYSERLNDLNVTNRVQHREIELLNKQLSNAKRAIEWIRKKNDEAVDTCRCVVS